MLIGSATMIIINEKKILLRNLYKISIIQNVAAFWSEFEYSIQFATSSNLESRKLNVAFDDGFKHSRHFMILKFT